MKAPVHILATVRRAELLPAARLVFHTLRTGFPSEPVCVWGIALDAASAAVLAADTAAVGGKFQNLPATAHDAWIETLVNKLTDPFWVCDTDVVFFDRMTAPKGAVFAGRYEPAFDEEFTDTVHMERLHTAVMYLNPERVRMAVREWMAKIPEPWRNSATFPLFRQNFVPVLRDGVKQKTLFYDTLAGLHQAVGGTAFTPAQDAAFEHLHCATYAQEAARGAASLKDLPAVHAAVYADPATARGLKLAQDHYYHNRKPQMML